MKVPVKSTTGPTGSRDRTKAFCGCGLSRTFPFCDGSQKIAKTHVAGKLMSCGPAEVEVSSARTREITA
jgi:CDGSH-type Zn-finger protein